MQQIKNKFTVTSKPSFARFLAVCALTLCCLFTQAQQSNADVKEGNEAYKKGDFAAAIKAYLKAAQTDDKNDVAKFNMGNALNKAKEAEKAAASYDDVITNSKDNTLKSQAYYNKALALLQDKKIQEAIDAFKQSLRMAPADNDARENLQKALQEQKQQQQQQQQQKPNNKPQQKDNKQDKKQQPKWTNKPWSKSLANCATRKKNYKSNCKKTRVIRKTRKKTGNCSLNKLFFW